MRACVLQGGGFSQSIHRHAFTLQHRTNRFKFAQVAPYAAPRPFLGRTRLSREIESGMSDTPKLPVLTRTQLPFVLTK